MTTEEYKAFVQERYDQGLANVKSTPCPPNQKFPPGTKVKVKGLTGFAIVEYTYAHAYGGDNVKDYSLLMNGKYSSAWHRENELEKIEE
jgi:hypothetical protein